MLKEAVLAIFDRDLNKLKEEISLYSDESKLWMVEEGISNSAGNLCLHLIGNLNHFIGATLGNNGYVRNRDSEFSLKDVPVKDLLESIDKTKTVIAETLPKLTDADIAKEFPLEVMGKRFPTGFFLLHLSAHLSYHLGQINYHRRLLQ